MCILILNCLNKLYHQVYVMICYTIFALEYINLVLIIFKLIIGKTLAISANSTKRPHLFLN